MLPNRHPRSRAPRFRRRLAPWALRLVKDSIFSGFGNQAKALSKEACTFNGYFRNSVERQKSAYASIKVVEDLTACQGSGEFICLSSMPEAKYLRKRERRLLPQISASKQRSET